MPKYEVDLSYKIEEYFTETVIADNPAEAEEIAIEINRDLDEGNATLIADAVREIV